MKKRIIRLMALLTALLCCCTLFAACDIDTEKIGKALDIADSLYSEISDILAQSSDGSESTGASPADTELQADTTAAQSITEAAATTAEAVKIDENGSYTTKEDVALYIHTYGKLPSNFITKSAAEKAGWSGSGSDALDNYSATSGKCIGGDTFGNYEGLLPSKSGRTWKECDIDTLHASQRGTKRIVFSNDGLIYYTEDHYTTFTKLYGD